VQAPVRAAGRNPAALCGNGNRRYLRHADPELVARLGLTGVRHHDTSTIHTRRHPRTIWRNRRVRDPSGLTDLTLYSLHAEQSKAHADTAQGASDVVNGRSSASRKIMTICSSVSRVPFLVPLCRKTPTLEASGAPNIPSP
jgi:hypothetical protein